MDIQAILEFAGGAQELGRKLGIRHQAIYQWGEVPAQRVIEVCRLTGLRPHDVRPDLYPDPRWTL
jgi:DNA-binding transcriptional regulator YdaS (Cro superfamily)